MNTLLKTCCLLLSPFAFANISLGKETKVVHEFAKFGIEGQVNLSKISWGLDTVCAGNDAYYESAAAILNTSSIAYTTDENKQPNFGLGLSLIGRFHISDTAMFIGRLGVEPGLEDSIALKLSDTNTIGQFGSDGVLKSNFTFSPAVFLGMNGMYLGGAYEMRSYDTPRDHSYAAANLVEAVKDHQLLLGFRVEREVLIDNTSVVVRVEGLSNFVAESDDGIKRYYQDVISYQGGTANNLANSLSVTNAHTKITKLSITIGAAFLTL